MKKEAFIVSLSLIISIFVLVSSVHAALVTSQASIPSPQSVVTFDNFAPGFIFGDGPQQVGTPIGEDIVWTTTDPYNESVIGCDSYGLGPNGYWDCGKSGFTGLDTNSGDMIFTFNSGPVSSVGGFINYMPLESPNAVVSAYDCSNNLLESYDITVEAPISTPGAANAGGFRGISRPTADICQFRVSNQEVVLDDLTFSRQTAPAAIPTMTEWGMIIFMVLAGLGSVYYLRRRRPA